MAESREFCEVDATRTGCRRVNEREITCDFYISLTGDWSLGVTLLAGSLSEIGSVDTEAGEHCADVDLSGASLAIAESVELVGC
jgi:hypothetical protein